MVAELNESALGTREYWDDFYETELSNFIDHGETGDVWFGEQAAARLVKWIHECMDRECRIIEIGSGNGHLLFALHSRGFRNLTGIDYSQQAVDLALGIARREYPEISAEMFLKMDIFSACTLGNEFDLVLDKGTFDAISLAPRTAESTAESEKSPADRYVDSVYQLLKSSALLLITSCNWTENELVDRFSGRFTLHSRIQHPVFKFGGTTGQTVTTVVLKRN